MIAGTSSPLGPLGGRLLVHVLSLAGFSLVVAAIYVVIVLGLGQRPGDHGDREILGLSMLAAAVTAVGYLARDRLMASATRFVYGAREAPDEALRTFGSRMTRAVAMDELLLQLAESLRKTMLLTSAEAYSGSGEVLERTVSVPDAGRRSILIGDRERPVVTRAGVSGSAWASIWLPALLDGRPRAQLRVAPISHAGELLGLLVVERPEDADAFTEEDDRVLTELARQAGLAFYNVRLDAALQTTLDELRHQADELRESRARVVASGDAERRRVERDLHDGAQQHLVALAVNLRLARDIMTDDPEAGAEMLAQMAEDVQATIRELRELAHGIYPPLLADNGLGEALRAAATRSPLPVTVTTDGIGRYSQGVETAIYFCCLEALQNAAKHAAGATVEVRLWEEAGGCSLGQRRRPGVRPGAGPRRSWVREHVRPAGRDRRDGPMGIAARPRVHDQRFGADHLTIKIHRPQRKPSRPAASPRMPVSWPRWIPSCAPPTTGGAGRRRTVPCSRRRPPRCPRLRAAGRPRRRWSRGTPPRRDGRPGCAGSPRSRSFRAC